MTAQFPEIVKYCGEECELAGVKGKGLFNPREHGIERPRLKYNSACRRGYVCFYAVHSQQLILDGLVILADHAMQIPMLFGVRPQPDPREWLDVVYAGLNHSVSYTGVLLLGRHLIEEWNFTLAYHAAWKYREVHELRFECGQLIAEADRSRDVEEYRLAHLGDPLARGAKTIPSNGSHWLEQYITREFW